MIEVAYTDTVNTCDCCGKHPLARTVAVRDDSGDELYLGSVCAGRYLGFRLTGNPHRALERLRAHMDGSELSLEDIREEIEERNAEKEA